MISDTDGADRLNVDIRVAALALRQRDPKDERQDLSETETALWAEQVAVKALTDALGSEPLFWADVAHVRAAHGAQAKATHAWRRARDYGPGAGLRGRRRRVIAICLLAAATVEPDPPQRPAQLLALVAATGTAAVWRGNTVTRTPYTPGSASLAPMLRGASMVAAARARRPPPTDATPGDFRSLFDRAAGVILNCAALPDDVAEALADLTPGPS